MMVSPFIFFAFAHPVLSVVTGLPVEQLADPFRQTAKEILLRGLHPRTTEDEDTP